MKRFINKKCKWFDILRTLFANREGIPSQPGLLLLNELITFTASISSICSITILLGLFCTL